MIGYIYTLTNSFNGKSFSIGLNDDGTSSCASGKGAIIQQNPVFELEVRNESRDKTGQHGIWDFLSFYGQRNISLSGIILGADHAAVVTMENLMREVLTLPAQPTSSVNDGYITISWTDALGTEWNINAKITKDLEFRRELQVRTKASFFIEMKASDPWILTTTENSTESLWSNWPTRMGWLGSQFIVPASLPNNINDVYKNLVNVYQKGTASAPGTYRIYGPATNPVLTKLTEVFSNDTVISNFIESAGWVGGNLDIVNYQTAQAARQLISLNGVEETMYLPGTWDLTSADFLSFYFHIDDIDNMILGDYSVGKNYIKFETNASNYFIAEFIEGNQTIRNNWNYFLMLRDEFKTVGSPTWANITKIEYSIRSKVGTSLSVTFDDLHVRDVEFTSQCLALNTTLSPGQYVDFDVQNGTIKREDDSDQSSYLTLDSEWFYLTIKQNLFLYDDDLTPPLTASYPYYYNNPVVETGLIGYYHFDAQDFEDYSSSDNSGAITVGANNFVQGDVSGSTSAWEMDNASYWEATSPYEALGVQTATVSTWFRMDDFTTDNALYSQIFGKSTSLSAYYDQSSDVLRINSYLDGVSQTVDVPTFAVTYSVDTWYSLVVTLDIAVGITVYINNVQVAQTLVTGAEFDADFGSMRFGADTAGTTFGRGRLDEIRLYDYVLDSDARQTLIDKPYSDKYLDQVQIYWYDAQL